ncbi:tetratricopeptide repeat protein [Methylibium sp.]|uniref:O-linked N-acetylglucosamine transferase family protein n=1 Tax=Methylibium sp. TaxID=2067992 RepID=UPI003D105E46
MHHAQTQLSRRAPAGHAHWQRGVDLTSRSDWRGAIEAFEHATREAPKDVVYWVNLANAYRRSGDTVQAVASAARALDLEPEHALALQITADCHLQAHRYADAVAVYERLERSGVRDCDLLVNHGAMLQALRRHTEAIGKFLEAAALKPDHVQAHAMMSTSFRDLGLKREAVECLKTVLALKPQNLQALSHESYEKRHICDWKDLDADVASLTQQLQTAPSGLARIATVFGLLSLPIDPALLLVAARGEALVPALAVTPLAPVAPAERMGARIRVGYLSYDFHEHPVSQLLVEVLEQRDRSQFDLVLYSHGPDDDSRVRHRLKAATDDFVDLRGLTDRQAAERIRGDRIDLLIDLQGHTRGQRLAILAQRPAPVQAAFLGYPGSTGADYIDYIVGDPLVTPIELAGHYSEKLAQLPLCFQPNGRWRPLPQPMTRQEAGLPDDAFVMCAFNHTYKILPEAFDAWCAVLREIPHAVLWLKETNGQLRSCVHAEAAARGVAPERIVFAQNVAFDAHFSRLALADVFVDTWPYNAHTTASDALWAGVPVVTLYQNSFASRVAASVLNAAGIAELAVETVDDYQRALLALASDPALLQTYRNHLQTQRMTLPLFDSQRYVREFEHLLARMVQRFRAGLPPDHLLASQP